MNAGATVSDSKRSQGLKAHLRYLSLLNSRYEEEIEERTEEALPRSLLTLTLCLAWSHGLGPLQDGTLGLLIDPLLVMGFD